MRRLLVLPIIAAIGFVAFPAGADDDRAEPSLETRQTSVETPSDGGPESTEDEVTVDVDGFGLVGLRWNGAEAAEFRVLVDSDGTWIELEHVEASHDGPDPDSEEGRRARQARGRDHVSDAYVVEDPSKVRVELVDGDVSDVEVISLETTDTSNATAAPVRADMAGRAVVIVALAGAAIALLLPANRRKLSSTAMVTVVALGLSTFAVACDPKPGSPPPQPAIASRASWGARAPVCSVKATTTLYQAVVHHTAGANSYSASQSAGIVKGIQNFHIDGNGWCDIGYNFLVDRYGNVFEGRYASTAQVVTGAHAAGYNTGSVGISVMGDFTSAAPPQAAVDSIVKVLTWKFSKHGTNPYQSIHRAGKWTDSIIGHRDANQTSCPGAQLYARLGEIRNRVKPNVTKPMPFGNFEGVSAHGANQISVQGWLIDPAYPSTPAKVHVYVGGPYGVGTLVYNGITTVWRPDVAAAYPGFGTQRGFNVISQKLGPLNQACVYVSAGPGRSPAMGCKSY